MCLAESSEDLGQINHAQGLDGTDVQLTAEHAANPGHRVTSLVDRCQDASRCGQEGPASLSQRDSAIVSHEECVTELSFKRFDRSAQARLDHMHPRRCLCEVQLLGDCDEVFNLAKLHTSILSIIYCG